MEKDVKRVLGVIEAIGPYTTTEERGGRINTVYSTIRLKTEDGRQIFWDKIQADPRIASMVAPGLAGVFYLFTKNNWLFAYRAGTGELVHDLDDAPKGLMSYRLLAIGVFVFFVYRLSGHGALGTLLWFSPVWLIGLFAWWASHRGQKHLDLLKKEIGIDDPPKEEIVTDDPPRNRKKQGFWLSGPAD